MTTTKAHKGDTGDEELQRSPFPLCDPALAQLAQSHLPAPYLQAHFSQYKLIRFIITDLLVLGKGND